MRTNLIQSYLNNPDSSRQYNSDKAVKDFDVHKELANRTFIKPLPSNGKLVSSSLFDMPSVLWKDIKYDFNAFGHALKGEANDHELGRLNDFGMKLGGLAIAGYLFTRKQTPMKKLFEFIGFAAFFGAMDIWPKLFLQVPAYLVHGINIRQQYEDSYGRKKMFYQDPQFIPWDLYSDKQINKIGDRLRIPKDIPNRREYIQEKMRKIALQNNTMWMLTAGFATPVLSALICNALEKPASRYIDKRMDAKSDALITNLNREIKKYDFSKNEKQLERIIAENQGKPITSETFEKILSNLSENIDPVTSSSIRKDLEQIMQQGSKYQIADETIINIHKALVENFKPMNLPEDELARIIPDAETIKTALLSNNLMDSEMKEFSEVTKVIQNLLEDKIADYLGQDSTSIKAKKLRFHMRNLGSSRVHGEDTPLQAAFKTRPASILTQDTANTLKEISKILNGLKAKCSVFDRFSFVKVAQAEETVLANSWQEISETLMKAMNFTPNEIKNAKFDREIAGKILRNKIEALTTDKEAFGRFIDEFGKVLSVFESKMSPLTNTDKEKGHLYHKEVSSAFDDCATELRAKNMHKTAISLAGYNQEGETSLKNIYIKQVADRINGVKYSFYRFFDTAAFYYRIAQNYKLDDILPQNMYRETKEEAVECAKAALLEGHTSDTSVKFFQPRYISPDKTDFSQIEVEAGKVKNKYLGTRALKDMVEYSNDNEYFDRVMKLMFDGEIHPDIVERVKNSTFFNDFMKYRKDALAYIGGDYYFAKPYHLVNGTRVDSSSQFKFLLMGCAPDEMFYKLFNNAYNSRKWFSMTGKLGAALIGVTLLSQFFIGKTKDPAKIKEVR